MIKIKIILFFSFLLFQDVNSQAAGSTRAPVTISPANQNMINMKVQEFNSDIQAMRANNTIDNQKLITDIQGIAAAARSSGLVIPTRVQNLVQDLINRLQQLETNGRSNVNQVLMMILGAKEEVMKEINISKANLAMTG